MDKWIVQGIAVGVRDDGRGALEVRRAQIESNVLVSCASSARVSRGSSCVVAGVKSEISSPQGALMNEGTVVVKVNIVASLHDDKKLREIENDLGRCLEASLGGEVIDRKGLCIVSGSDGLAWTLFVDVVSFGNPDAGLLDSCSLAVRAALCRTKLPKISPLRSALFSKPDFTVEPDLADAIPLNVANVPVMVTVALFGTIIVLDPSQEEVAFADAHIIAAVALAGQISYSRVQAKSGLAPTILFSMLNAAKETAVAAIRSLEDQLKQEDVAQEPKKWLVMN